MLFAIEGPRPIEAREGISPLLAGGKFEVGGAGAVLISYAVRASGVLHRISLDNAYFGWFKDESLRGRQRKLLRPERRCE